MGKKKLIKIISFLIITFWVFQLIPITLTHVEGFQSNIQNSKVFLSSVSFNSDVLYIGRESQKTSIQKVQIKNASICIPQLLIEDISVINLSYQEMQYDHRKDIRESIPHYFNGGKYKGNHFAV